MNKLYGQELILDLHGCDTSLFNRDDLTVFFRLLCKRIDMRPEALYFWDDVGLPPEECQTEPHTKGTSAVQFILTSSIVVHALDLTGKVFVNIFSCKEFNSADTELFCVEFFKAESVGNRVVIERD
jgi:S-adenosylmethionine/arginine decarboxylase-like enzyme